MRRSNTRDFMLAAKSNFAVASTLSGSVTILSTVLPCFLFEAA